MDHLPSTDPFSPPVEVPSSAGSMGAGSPPLAAAPARRGRRAKPGPEQATASPAPWTNFNAPPPDANAVALEAATRQKREKEEREAELATLDGYSRHLCLRDNGSGKYRKGRTYILPDGQPEALFRNLDSC